MSLFRGIRTKPNPYKTPPVFSLRKFHKQRNKVLIMRETGGLGDIMMHRMMFEDFHLIAPDVQVHFACLPQYHGAIIDHPFIDEVLDYRSINPTDYLAAYNTTSACTRYEIGKAPFSGLHRSDIWANHCGIRLTRHNMHIQLQEKSLRTAEKTLTALRKGQTGPSVMICPISAMVMKNLTNEQLEGTVKGLWDRGCFVFGCHKTPIEKLVEMKVPMICDVLFPDLFAITKACDYVVSVDTGQFHIAGGLGVPVTGIFTFADGKVYSKYYQAELVQKHRDDGNWDCGPCYNWGNCPKSKKVPKPCLTEISVSMILDGVDRMMKRWTKSH